MAEGAPAMGVPSPLPKFRPQQDGSFDSPYKAPRPKGALLKDALELVRAPGENGRGGRYQVKPLEEKLSFDKGFYVFIRAVQLLAARNKGVILVGLAGPSGSGKSVFSEKVTNFIPGTALINMDMYNDASRLIDSNFDDPRLTDYDLLLENLRDLREGKPTKIPVYSFKESRRVGYREQAVPKSRIVVIEGIYALSQRIRPLLDLRVSITGGVHFDLVKRVLRDISRSGQAPEEIIQQISDTVYPMYKAFIEPDLKTAHLHIANTFNPFSGFMNATYILKSDKPVSRDAIRACLQADHTQSREAEMFDIYLLPPGEDPETCQSWLRMRNRDGRYDLRFEEWVVEGPFVISPRISFEVNVRILGGLMALGYEIGTIMKRTSVSYSDAKVTIKLDDIEGMDRTFVQVQGKERELVAAIGKQLGLEGSYIPRSYIEQIQLEKLTASFQSVPEDLRQHFSVDGEPMLDDSPLGRSPSLRPAFRRTCGFSVPDRPSLASSAPTSAVKPLQRAGSDGSQVNGLIAAQLRRDRGGSDGSGGSRGGGGGGGSGRSSGSSRRSSGDLDFAFEDPARHQQQQQRQAGAAQHKGGEGARPGSNGSGGGGGGSSTAQQLGKLEAMLQALGKQLARLGRPPEDLGSKLDVQVQALTAQQQALNQQVQEVARALERLEAASAAAGKQAQQQQQPPPVSWQALLPAAALVAAAAAAAGFAAARAAR